MAGESDPPIASPTANDSCVIDEKSAIIISNKGSEAEEQMMVDELMDRIIPTTDESNDNKNGANNDAKNDGSSFLMGALTAINDFVNVSMSNDYGTSSDNPPPSVSLAATTSEITGMMATRANINYDQQQPQQQQPVHTQEEGKGGATNVKISDAKTSSSDDSSNTIACSDATIPVTSAPPAVVIRTSPIVSDTAASVSDPNETINNGDNIISNDSSHKNNKLMIGMMSGRDLQINEILHHRRQLLTWVRTCRKQSQIVYEEMIRSTREDKEYKSVEQNQRQQRRQGLISKLSSSATVQEGVDLSSNASQMQLEGEGFIESLAKSEIAAYQAITGTSNRNPNQLKRSRPSSSLSLNENNNQRDLRRGPFVGKSFNANASALSSKIPGSGGGPNSMHASSSTSTLPHAVDAQTSLSNIYKHQGKQFHKYQPPHGEVPATTPLPLNHASSSIALANNHTEKQKKSRKRKANNSNINNFTNHDRMSNTLPPLTAGPPSHPSTTNNNTTALMTSFITQRGGMKMTLPNNNLLSTPALVPSVEAVNFLGIRNDLLAKLDSLLFMQKTKKQRYVGPNNGNEAVPSRMDVDQNDGNGVAFAINNTTQIGIEIESANEKDAHCTTPSVTGDRNPSPSVGHLVASAGEKFGTSPPKHSSLPEVAAWQPNERHSHLHHHPKPPLRLPIRRKTQWDCVLEEMKWMSADFHEERKWKIAAGQTLSASVRKFKSKKKLSTSSLIGTTPTKMSLISRSGSNVSSSSRSRTMSINSFSLNTSGSCIASDECNDLEPLYVDASIKDVETVKIISRLLSLGILDHWDSISTSRHHDVICARQQRFHRLVELESLGNDTVKLVKSVEINSHAQVGETSAKFRDDESLQSSNSIGAVRELHFDEISSRIEASLKLVNALKHQAFNQSSNTNSCGGSLRVELDQRQLNMVHFVERLWSSTNGIEEERIKPNIRDDIQTTTFNNDACNSISAIVGGSFGIGKTVAVCALLWSNKINGPQIIVCSPGSVIRWIHELKKFNDLRSRIYSRGDSRAGYSYNASDIVVCDYGLLFDLVDNDDPCLSKANFAAMILDIRHCGSEPTRYRQPKRNEMQYCHTTTQSPLNCVKWWVCVNNFIAKCPNSLKRLVIEQSDHCRNRFVVQIDEHVSLRISEGVKERARKLLAMKLAFVFHPSTFVSESGSVGKRVISWAKFQAKKVNKPANKLLTGALSHVFGKGNGALASWGWSAVLTALLQNVCYSSCKTIFANCDDGIGSENSPTIFSWNLQLCSLGKSQRAAYETCVATMRCGSDEAIARGLLELRKVCIHSSLREIVASLVEPIRRRDIGMRKEGSSILTSSATHSESNVELAKKIMKKSAKMKELLRVLLTEGGCNVASRSELIESLLSEGSDDQTSAMKVPAKKAKVLILATLVEAQLLASSFLSAVGLHHEVLVSSETKQHSSPLHASHPSRSILSPSHTTSSVDGHPWAWCQVILSRFSETCTEQSIDILISSPITISSLTCGIGVANANIVICIDEDWSGREALHIKSIFAKIHWSQLRSPAEAASSAAKVPCKFIKLICRNTCENAFLCDWDTQKKVDTQKQCKMGIRRSSRQAARASKVNQHEPVVGIENDNIRKHTGFCPIQVVPDAALVNCDGFVIPPGNGGNGQTIPIDQYIVGANVLRYRNIKLSTVFFVSNSVSGMIFLPTRKSLDHLAVIQSDSFSWALFNVEDREFFHVTIPAGIYSPGLEFGVHPIISSPTAASYAGDTSVRHYVESFKRSHSFIPHKCFFEPMYPRDERIATGEGMVSGRNSARAFSPSTDVARKSNALGDNNSDLSVYMLPNEVFRKRKISAVDFDPYRTESNLDVFSFCYSVINASPSALLMDRNEGSEPLVYSPSFFPYLLQESRKLVYSPLSALVETHAASPLKKRFGLSEYTSSEFSFTIETNPHAFSGYQIKAGNEELSFQRRLLATDVQNSISYQSKPSLNSIILISEKKRPEQNHTSGTRLDFAGHVLSDSSRKSSILKKMKRQSHFNSSSAPEKGLSYFHNKRLIDQACYTKGTFTPSNMGRLRLNCRLNDLVSDSFSQSCLNLSMPESETTCRQIKLNGSIPIRQNIRPVLLGAIPLSNEELMLRKSKYRSGIILPVGIDSTRMEMKLPSSQRQFPEPWSKRDDSILKGCVSRYGMNWQLAAYAVSSGMSCSPGANRRSEDSFRKATKRSAVQCQNRWGFIKSDRSSTTSGLNEKNNDGFYAAIVREAPLLGTKSEGIHRESIIFERSHHCTRSEQLPDQNGSTMLSSEPKPINGSQTNEEESVLHLLARVQKLKDASSKRVVINIPLPSFAPTHPSHSEAVQAAKASMLSATNVAVPPRHEMWPLELLDFRKQHNSEAKGAPHPSPASSQSPHRHQSSIPHHVPHAIHPTQSHMMYHEAGQVPPPHQPYHQHHQPAAHHSSNVVYKVSQPTAQRRQH